MASSLETEPTEVLKYEDGKTEYGKHAATRLSQSDNAKFSRFFMNAGTKNREYYKVIRGSQLAPGGAKQLNQDEAKYNHFDLRYRRSQMNKIEGYIFKFGPCVQMAQSKGYNLRPSTKPRRLDSYMRVQYRNNTKPIEWVSRTEFSQLVGRP